MCMECLNEPADSRVVKVPADPMARRSTGRGAPVLQSNEIYGRIILVGFISADRGQYSESLL